MADVEINYYLNENDYHPAITIKYDPKEKRYRFESIGDTSSVSTYYSDINPKVEIEIGYKGEKYKEYDSDIFTSNDLKIKNVNQVLLNNLKEALLNMSDEEESKFYIEMENIIETLVNSYYTDVDTLTIYDDLKTEFYDVIPENVRGSEKIEDLINKLVDEAYHYNASWDVETDIYLDNIYSLKKIAKHCKDNNTLEDFLICINNSYSEYDVPEAVLMSMENEYYENLAKGMCSNVDLNYDDYIEEYGKEAIDGIVQFCKNKGYIKR